jgi:hypothetical protein
MKNIFLGLAIMCIGLPALAENADWNITEVLAKDKTVSGYIYHTGAVGTQIGVKAERMITSLRLVCTAKSSSPASVAIFWDTMKGNSPQYLEMRTEKTEFTAKQFIQWEQDGPLLIRSAPESKMLVQMLKTNKLIGFTWLDTNSIRRTTMFDLKGFNAHLTEFNALCKTDI